MGAVSPPGALCEGPTDLRGEGGAGVRDRVCSVGLSNWHFTPELYPSSELHLPWSRPNPGPTHCHPLVHPPSVPEPRRGRPGDVTTRVPPGDTPGPRDTPRQGSLKLLSEYGSEIWGSVEPRGAGAGERLAAELGPKQEGEGLGEEGGWLRGGRRPQGAQQECGVMRAWAVGPPSEWPSGGMAG